MQGKEIYVYVGPHRSGSTFLQTQIFPNLQDVAFVYTRDPEANRILFDAMDEHPMFSRIDEIRERLAERISKFDENKILFSDEEFFGDYGRYSSDGAYISKPFYDNAHRTEIIARLFDKPKVIMTPRRQDTWVESAYNHFIHNFFSLTMSEFLNPDGSNLVYGYTSKSMKPCCDITALDWGVYVQNYIDVLGKDSVLVVPNEVVRHELDDAVERMCRFMAIPVYHPAGTFEVNRSYTRSAHRIAMILNRFVHTPTNPWGFIPLKPFMQRIQRRREKKDNRLLWFLAGISRRISLHWFLNDIVSARGYKRHEYLGPAERERILDYYRDRNRQYAQLIGIDLEKYGYY